MAATIYLLMALNLDMPAILVCKEKAITKITMDKTMVISQQMVGIFKKVSC